MNPLMVIRRFGEAIDPALINLHPISYAKICSRFRLQVYVGDFDAHLISLQPRWLETEIVSPVI